MRGWGLIAWAESLSILCFTPECTVFSGVVASPRHTDSYGESSDETDDEDESDESSDTDWESEGVAPTPKRCKYAKETALRASLNSGLYPTFEGIEGPSRDIPPNENNPFEYLSLLWPASLCELIALETDRYALQNGARNWQSVSVAELWTFLGIILLMGIHRLPRIRNYWSNDRLLGIAALQQYMSLNRFWALWSNLHVVDNELTLPGEGVSRKIKPVLDTLSRTFLEHYSPGQELSVDEGMVKYKGCAGGKVVMPNKPIKKGFKIWCCSCSCCAYLCTFQVYQGRPVDPSTGKRTSEKGLAKRVVSDLVAPFVGLNHVVYCDNFYSSGPLVDMLAKDKIFVAGTIKKCAKGFPDSLKRVKPLPGTYVSERVDEKCYFVFQDRREVCFVTNVFPEHMDTRVARMQSGGLLQRQSVPPLLPAYNKYMGGVDRTDQIRKSYGFDRKSKRSWLRLFFQFFDYAVNNAHILYKHSCSRHGISPNDLLEFRMELIHLLLVQSRQKAFRIKKNDRAQDVSVCYLVSLSEIGLKRGRCHQCQLNKRKPSRYTSFGCGVCGVRLCKTTCFAEFHQSFS